MEFFGTFVQDIETISPLVNYVMDNFGTDHKSLYSSDYSHTIDKVILNCDIVSMYLGGVSVNMSTSRIPSQIQFTNNTVINLNPMSYIKIPGLKGMNVYFSDEEYFQYNTVCDMYDAEDLRRIISALTKSTNSSKWWINVRKFAGRGDVKTSTSNLLEKCIAYKEKRDARRSSVVPKND